MERLEVSSQLIHILTFSTFDSCIVLRYRYQRLPLHFTMSYLCDIGDTPSSNLHFTRHILKQHIFSSMDLFQPEPNLRFSAMKWCITVSPMRTLNNSAVPSGEQGTHWRINISLIRDVSYDAHPMAILTSAFAYLGSYYSEANPSLQGSFHFANGGRLYWTYFIGQTLYTKGDKASLAVMDKQIYRLIGKATTLAAWVRSAPSHAHVSHTPY